MQKNLKAIKKVLVFDIDGVLLCSQHRFKTISTKKGERLDLDHWKQNSHKVFNDKKLPTALLYEKALKSKSVFVVIATSRLLKTADYQMIDKTMGFPDSIVSRIHDNQSTENIKIQGFQRVLDDCNLNHIKPENVTIYEDNISNLKSFCDAFGCHGVYIPSKQGI